MKTVGLIINPLPVNIPKKETKSNPKKPAPKPPKAKKPPKETEPPKPEESTSETAESANITDETKVPENGAD